MSTTVNLSTVTETVTLTVEQNVAGADGVVVSVNGETGTVVIDADDIDDATTTNKFATEAELTKLAGIEAGAEVNVNADWNAVSGDAQILNKPTLGSAALLDVGVSANQVVQLDGSARLPAVDGSQLTNVSVGPGGSDTEIQYNDTGSFAGDSKFTYDSTTGSVTLGGATVTADSPVLNLSQTWNNGAVAFTGLKLDVTKTAALSTSSFLKIVDNGDTVLDIYGQSGGPNPFTTISNPNTNFLVIGKSGGGVHFGATSGTTSSGRIDQNGLIIRDTAWFGFGNGINPTSTSQANTRLYRDADDTLALRRSTNNQTFRCYGTYTDSSNYVRASLSADSTSTTLAAETAGTGADDVALNLTAAGAGTVKVNSVAEVAVSSTVAGLPSSPTVGMISRVTDADTPSIGSTVTGGGSSAALVWYNGTNWTVIGV